MRVHEPLGHSDVSTTMIYIHVLNRGRVFAVLSIERGRQYARPLRKILAIVRPLSVTVTVRPLPARSESPPRAATVKRTRRATPSRR